MLQIKKAGLLAVLIVAVLAVPGTAVANTGTVSSAGSAYTGNANLRLVAGSNVTLTAATGVVKCTSNTTGSPAARLASFGEGNVTNSSITTTLTTNGTITNIDFGNPLLQVSSTVTHNATTSGFASGTPVCPSTIPAISGGCTGRGVGGTGTNAYNLKTQYVVGPPKGFKLSILIPDANPIQLKCFDGSGNPVNCLYATGPSPSSNVAITSDLISFNTGGSTAAATAKFTSQDVHRTSASSTLCPATAKFDTSTGYQLYTGQVYPGGTAIYAVSSK